MGVAARQYTRPRPEVESLPPGVRRVAQSIEKPAQWQRREVVRTQTREHHDRMPVALPPEAAETWLDPDQPAPALLPLLRPLPAGILTATRVSTRVNQVRHDAPDCLAPEAETAAEEDGQLGLAGLG